MGKRRRPENNKTGGIHEKKVKKSKNKSEEFEFDPVPTHLVIQHLKKQEKRVIIILENAQLETVKVS